MAFSPSRRPTGRPVVKSPAIVALCSACQTYISLDSDSESGFMSDGLPWTWSESSLTLCFHCSCQPGFWQFEWIDDNFKIVNTGRRDPHKSSHPHCKLCHRIDPKNESGACCGETSLTCTSQATYRFGIFFRVCDLQYCLAVWQHSLLSLLLHNFSSKIHALSGALLLCSVFIHNGFS